MGVILFRMFTGRLPFSGADLLEVLRDHLETPPPRPTAFNPEIPAALESIILTALEKDPARRFASAEAFLLALDPIEPANVRVSTESGRVVRVPRTQKGPATVVASAPTRAVGSEDDEDQEVVKGYPAQLTVQAEPARPTRVLDRAEPAPRPQRPKPAPPSQSPRRTGLVVGTAAAALILAGLIGWRLTQSPAPAPSISADVPATGPAITAPAATLEPPPTQAPASLLAGPATTLRAAASATPRPPRATLGPAPTAPPATQPPTTLPPATTVATPPPTTTMAPAPSTTMPSPKLSPEQGVRQAIEEYAAALGSRDDQRMIRIYPGFPPKNLEELRKAFKDYSVSVVALDKITVEPNRVFAEVRLRHTFTSFSGKQESETRKEKMIFFDARRRLGSGPMTVHV